MKLIIYIIKNFKKVSYIFLFSNNLFSQSIFFDDSRNYFSPNSDGLNDTMIFNITYPSKKKVIDWILTVYDETGKNIKSYQAYHGQRKSKSLLNLIFKDRQEPFELYLPNKIEWLGTDKKGKLLQDGRYSVRMKYFYEDTDSFETIDKYFYLDSKKAIGKSVSDKRIFSPNNDKVNDTVVINHYFEGDSTDRWKGLITNSQNQIIRSYIWDTLRLPKQILWDGKDDRGILQEEGLYKYILQSEDFSGNKYSDELSFLQLSNSDMPDIYPDLEEFSPNQDGIKDTIIFKLFPGMEKKIEEWKINIVNLQKPEKYKWQYESSAPIPTSILWDGQNQNKNKEYLPDGDYSVTLEINPNSSKKQESNSKKFSINSKKPYIKFKIKGDHFTPDGDGDEDILEIFPEVKNLSFKTWKVSIVENYLLENGQEKKRTLKRWSGFYDLPNKFIWDGISDDGILTTSLSNFSIYFSFRNELNESKIYEVKNFNTGILISQITKQDFKINIPEHVLRVMSDTAISNLKSIIPYSFSNYHFQIQSHSKVYGDNKRNKIKTESRSKEINDKLFYKNKTKEIVNFQGCGEIYTIFIEDDQYKQEKNDRIEILISKNARIECYKGY